MHITRFTLLLASAAALLLLLAPSPAGAQSLIRDTEIENYMREWFTPVFQAAGMAPDQVSIIIVQDPDINAFVAGGANIFFYTGLLQRTDSPTEVIGVMAHELGHVAGGHLIRGREEMAKASYESILGAIVGIGTAIATGDGAAAGAIGIGSASMAQRRFLATSRVYESSADQAALTSLNKAGIDPEGLVTFLEKLESEELLPASQQSEYVRTHPLTRDRIESVRAGAANLPSKGKAPPAAWTEQHARMKAKLLGFISPEQVVWHYDDRDRSVAAVSARAVAAYRQNDVSKALTLADELIAKEPENPYFQELKGQMLVDFGRVGEALPYYQKAVSLEPGAGLIRTALAHAQIESAGNDSAKLEAAIVNLERALRDEPRSTRIHRLLATAYGRTGNDAVARLHLAEEAFLQRKKDYAKQQAEVALKGLPEGSRPWLRARDLLADIERDKD